MINNNHWEAWWWIIYWEGIDFNKPWTISVLWEAWWTEVIWEWSEISIFKEDTAEQINNLI